MLRPSVLLSVWCCLGCCVLGVCACACVRTVRLAVVFVPRVWRFANFYWFDAAVHIYICVWMMRVPLLLRYVR